MPKTLTLFRLMCLFALLGSAVFWLPDGVSSQSKTDSDIAPPAQKNEIPPPTNLDDTPHDLVGAYYTLENNTGAELMLNNKGGEDLEVRPTIYNAQGQELQLPPVTVPAQSFRFIDLQEWADIGGASYQSGNIKLFHRGRDLVLGAQIYLTDETHSLSFEEKLAELGKFDSHRQESAWHMPGQQAEVKVVLTNARNAALSVTAKLSRDPNVIGDAQIVELAPHETKILDLRQDFVRGRQFAKADVVGLSLTHAGAKDALLARVMIADADKGYSNAAQFSNPAGGKSSEYEGVGFQIESVGGVNLLPVIVAKNAGTATARVTARVPYTRADGSTGVIELPQKELSPGEVGLLDTGKIVARTRQEQIKASSLEIKYDTAPGSVFVSAYTASADGNLVFRVPMWDPLGQRSPTGGYPWRIEGSSATKIYIKNITDAPQKYMGYLRWESGTEYTLGLRALAPHETVEIDVKALRDAQTPDQFGRVIPPGISKGQFKWSLKREDVALEDEDPKLSLAVIGRSEQVDLARGISNNYACQNCCGVSYYSSYLSPGSVDVEAGDVVDFDVYQQDRDCYGVPTGYYLRTSSNGFTSWNSSDTGVATVNDSIVTTVDEGAATIKAQWSDSVNFMNEGYPCGGTYLTDESHSCGEAGGAPRTDRKDAGAVKPEGPESIRPCGPYCQSTSITPSPSTTIRVRPRVTSISATLPSTRNAVTSVRPTAGTFTTTNRATAFATGAAPSDLLVTFKSGDANLSVSAVGTLSTRAANSLKWKIDRDTLDSGLTGTPTLSATTGKDITVTPNTHGNFRLICYYDTNNNGAYDAGEELRILRLAVVQTTVDMTKCTMTSTGWSFSMPTPTRVGTANAMRMSCEIVIESGGADKRVGLDKVKFGNVGNLIEETFTVNYPGFVSGRGIEVPGGAIPMVDTVNVTAGNAPTGADTPFRGNSMFTSANNASGGQTRALTSLDDPAYGWALNHTTTANIWETTVGKNKFREFVVGYTDTFPRAYVGVAKAEWEVLVIGDRDAATNDWKQATGAAIQVSASISSLITGGTPQSGDSAAVQVLGLSFVRQYYMDYVVP
jgi:hypothetical protein